MHTGRMGLTPIDPLQAPDHPTTVALLLEAGLVGAPLEGADGFAIGTAFDELVGFTGCAVQFDLPAADAPTAANGPWLRIPEQLQTPRLMFGRNSRPPRCPSCGAALRPWRAQLASALPASRHALDADAPDTPQALQCGACHGSAAVWRWDWGRHAAAGRTFVWVEEVFPGEAAPLPGLLRLLEPLGVGGWRHFYVQD